jgi:hypothetical protein
MTAPLPTIAPLANVARLMEVATRLKDRPAGLPGFGLFSGPAGYGKSMAAQFVANKTRAHYVEVKSVWTQRALVSAIQIEMGLLPPREVIRGSVWKAVDEIGLHMAENPSRPLIIDEADHLVRRRMIEIVRDIHKDCGEVGGSIVLVGEQGLPKALKQWERIDSRILARAEASALSQADILTLADIVCPGLEFGGAALERLEKQASARRIVVSLNDIKERAALAGKTVVDAALVAGA